MLSWSIWLYRAHIVLTFFLAAVATCASAFRASTFSCAAFISFSISGDTATPAATPTSPSAGTAAPTASLAARSSCSSPLLGLSAAELLAPPETPAGAGAVSTAAVAAANRASRWATSEDSTALRAAAVDTCSCASRSSLFRASF